MKKLSILIVSLIISMMSFAQVREIPKAVEETFTSQYPSASDIEYKDHLTRVHVHFTKDGERLIATYNNKGHWKGSEKEWDYEKLDATVKDGFTKSKYYNDEWEVVETVVLYLPGGGEQYRIQVKKNDLQKKYLFYNGKGRMVREAITL